MNKEEREEIFKICISCLTKDKTAREKALKRYREKEVKSDE